MRHRRRVDVLVAKRTALQACALLLMLLAACSNKSAEQRLGEARTLLEEGNVLGAIIAYEDLVKKFPDSPMINEARIGLAQAYFSDSDYASSRELLDEVIVATGGRGTGMGHAAAMLKLDTYMAEEKFSAALDDARVTSASLSMLDPSLRGEFLLSLGQILAVNDFADEAMKVFSEALRDDPVGPEQQMSHMDTLSSAFNILMRGSNVDATMALYDEYFILHPDSELRGEISRDLGFIFRYVEMRDIANNLFMIAEAIFRRRMEDPIDTSERSYLVFVLAQVILLQDKVDEAQAMYRTLINDYAQSLYRPEGMIQLAQTLYQAGDLSAALDVLSRVMQDYPDSEEAEHAFSHAQSMRNAPPATPAPPAEISQPPDTPEAGSDVTEPATEPTTEPAAEPAANQ